MSPTSLRRPLTAQRPAGYLPTLDGWRAVAILGVMIAHSTDALFAPGAPLANPGWHAVTRYGAKGVDLFFGISGLLICSRLLEEHEQRGAISLKGFYVRRFARILPPYLAYLVVIATLSALGVLAAGRSELLHSAFFLRNYLALEGPAGTGWYTAHLWSLAMEEHFYLIWPTLLVLWTPPRALSRVVLLALAITVWRWAVFHWPGADPISPTVSRFVRTDLRLDALLWGCGMALVMWRPAARAWLAARLTTGVWLVACAALLTVIVVPMPFSLLWQSLLIPVALAGTILRPDGRPAQLLESPPARWVGRISYSLYLWQTLFLVAFGLARPFGMLQQLPLSLAAVFAAASLSYYAIERPMVRLGHRLAPPTTEGRI